MRRRSSGRWWRVGEVEASFDAIDFRSQAVDPRL
jgi:hypothetical protein